MLREELGDNFVSIPNLSLARNDRTTVCENSTIKRGGGICTYIYTR